MDDAQPTRRWFRFSPRHARISPGNLKLLYCLAFATLGLLGVGYFAGARIMFGAMADLNARDEMTLYSIDGTGDEPDDAAMQDKSKFCGYPVLGKVQIRELSDRQEIVTALRQSVARSRWGRVVKCWWPRHGVRLLAPGTQIDVVICFQCDRLQVYRDGVYSTSEPMSDGAKAVLNRHLQKAGIPLAPEDE